MKKVIGSLILFLLSISFVVHAQEIDFQKNLETALSRAAKTNKPVFLYINATPKNIPTGVRVNLTSGLGVKDVIDFYNKKFISFQAYFTDSVGIKLRAQYHLTTFPAFVFLDSKGQLVYTASRNSQVGQKYFDMANAALERIASGKTLSYYEQLDKQETITTEQLKEYITLREEFNLFDNAALADKYVKRLPPGSSNDYQQVLFILKAGPYAYGKAYDFCLSNRKIYDSIYRHEPSADRSAMNGRITSNTRNEAVKTKNIQLAQQAARYTAATWGQNTREANRALTGDMIAYYYAIKDTANYYQQASFYFDTYYMNISLDSAKKLQQQILDGRAQAFKPEDKKYTATQNYGNGFERMSAVVVVQSTPASQVASTLNSGAYAFYALGTNDADKLAKALVWVNKAIKLLPSSAGFYDTRAHLMYRLNLYDEAILNQSKAVEMSTQSETETEQNHLKEELAKMKAHSL